MFSLLQHSLLFIVQSLLLLVLVCPLHAGIDSIINFNLQAIPPASFPEVVATSYPAPLFQAQLQEWLLRDINDGGCQTPGYSFWGKDRLPEATHRRLLSEIEKAAHEDIPVSLKEYLETRRPPEEETLPQNEMNAPASPPPAIAVELLSEEEQFQRLWADLSAKTLVVVADLELLAGYKGYMTMKHIVSILKRADVGMEPYRFDELRQLLGEKKDRYLRHDPLLLNLSYEVVNYLIEADI